MGMRLIIGAATVLLAVGVAAGGLFLSGTLTSQATQNPTISLDMVTTGNAYSDPGLGGDNSMAVGTIENCLNAASSTVTHNHAAQLIIQNVEDLVAYQARLNYIGDKLRPSVFNPTPFSDTLNGGSVGFINLPLDTGV